MNEVFLQAIGETRRTEWVQKERIYQIIAVVYKVVRKLETRTTTKSMFSDHC